MIKILQLLIILFPWRLKRWALIKFFGFEIDITAKIGYSWIYPNKLIMCENARINHFTVAINLDLIQMNRNTYIGRNNWITGFSSVKHSKHFIHQKGRESKLIMGAESNITNHHHIDCTSPVILGKFVTVAGYYSQFLTHSINLKQNIQDSNSISLGDYTFIGTNSTILGGSVLPDYSVLAAKSLLNKKFDEAWGLYGGVPASKIKMISKDFKYFSRDQGYIY